MPWTKKNIERTYRTDQPNTKTIVKYVTVGSKSGSDGRNGTNAINIYVSKTSGYFTSQNGHALDASDNINVVAYSGVDRIDTSVGTITGIVSGITPTILNNGEKNTSIRIDISTGLTTEKGTLNIPVFVNLLNPRDSSTGGKDPEYWDASVFDLTRVDLTYDWGLVANPGSDVSIYNMDLSNQVAAVNCDANGNVLPGAVMPTCTAELTLNGVTVADASYGITVRDNLVGVTIDTSTGVLTFNGSTLAWTGNSTQINVKGYVAGNVMSQKYMTLLKSLPGGKGEDAVSYWINLSAPKIKVDPNVLVPVADPSTITATAYKQVGGNTPTVADDCSIFYGYDTTTPTTLYTAPITNIDIDKGYIYFILKKNNVYLGESELVPIMWEGMNGMDGSNGINAYRLDLTNENMSINCDASGNILPGAHIPSSTAKLYYGDTVATGVTYSIQSTSSVIPSGSITINSSTGVITILNTLSWNATALEVVIKAVKGTVEMTTVLNISKSLPGTNGVSVNSITNYYAAKEDTFPPSSGSYTTTIPADYGASKPYLWNYEHIIYSNDTSTKTTPGIISKYGIDGSAGVGLKRIDEYYNISDSSTNPPQTWSKDYLFVPTAAQPYLWNKENIIYTNDSSTWTSPRVISVRGNDGSAGANGVDALKLDLTNENCTVNVDASGRILTTPSCTATLYQGSTVLTGVSYSIGTSTTWSGISINSSTGVMTFSSSWNFTTNSIEIPVTAKINNVTKGVAIMSINKSFPGADGADAVRYFLSPSVNSIKVKGTTVTPSTIKVSVFKQVGAQTPTQVTDSTITVTYGYDNTSPTTVYTKDSSLSLSSAYNYSFLKFMAKAPSLSNSIVDSETIPIVKDGVDGSAGINGTSPYVLTLTNENTSIIVDASGNIPSTSVRPTCTATLYYGDTAASNVTYSMSANTSTSGISINSSTGVITFSSSSISFGADTLYLTITAKINNVVKGTAVMTVTKVYPGINGKDGSAAVVYWIVPSSNTATVTGTTIYPSSVTVNVYKQVGGGATQQATSSDGTLYWMDSYNQSWISMNIGGSQTLDRTNSWYKFKFAKSSSGNPYDQQTVTILRNGVDGINGTNGTDGVSIHWLGDLTTPPYNPSLNDCFRYSGTTTSTWYYGYVYIYNGSAWGIMNHDGSDGEDGADGTDGKSVFITYHNNAIDNTPSKPTGTGTTGGWHTNADASANWMSQKVDASAGGSATWTDAILIRGKDGSNGTDGQDAISYWLELSANEVSYDVNTAGYPCSPNIIYAKAWRQVGEQTPELLNNSYIKYAPDASYGTIAYNGSIDPTQYVPTHKYITVTLFVNNIIRDNETIQLLPTGRNGNDGSTGEKGLTGPTVRGPIKWEDSSSANARRFCNGQPNIDYQEDQQFIDVVMTSDGSIYYCTTSFTGTSSSTWNNVKSYFTKSNKYNFIATDLLLATNAKIDFLTGNEIHLLDSSGNVSAGAKGGTGVNFWAGSSTPANGKFQVTNLGKLTATDASIAGTVNASSGKIAGFNISGNSLTNGPDFNNDATIIFRNDTNHTFAGMGGNVLPASSGLTGIARFENNSTSDYPLSTNYNVLIETSGQRDNCALNINGGYISGFNMKNRIISDSDTKVALTRSDYNVILINNDALSVSLPEMKLQDDGHVIRFKRIGSGSVKVYNEECYTWNGTSSRWDYPVIHYNSGSKVTGANYFTIDSVMDSFELVWVRDLNTTSGSTTYHGAWIQYKMPRDW